MSGKQVIRLLIVLALLIGLSLLIPRFLHRKTSRRMFADFPADQWTRIVINNKTNEEVALVNSDDGWHVVSSSFSYRADQTSLKSLLDALGKLELKDIISSNEKRHARFEVTPASGTKVRLYTADSNEPKAAFFIGKATPDYTNYYVRLDGENEVYHAEGLSRYLVNKDLNRWRNRKLGVEDREAVNSVVFSSNEVTHRLVRDGDVWEYNDVEVQEMDVAALLGSVAALTASDLIHPQEEKDIRKDLPEKEDMKLLINEAGKEVTLRFFPKKEDNKETVDKYYVLKSGSNGIFMINSSSIQNITGDFEKLKEISEKPPVEEQAPTPPAQ